MERLRIVGNEHMRVGVYQPGNGTKYVCYASKIPHDVAAAHLVDQGLWLVSFPEWGSSYYIHPGSYLDLGYMAEKWGFQRGTPKPREINIVDLSEMAKLIGHLVPDVRVESATDLKGHLLPEWEERLRKRASDVHE